MASMIPPVLDPDTTPDSEKLVYTRLRDRLPGTWKAIHGQRFLLPAKHGTRAREGELDFLVLDPSRGALGLEVKGGRVERRADGWVSTDRRDERHDIKDPGKQASHGVHAIRKYLEKAPDFGGRGFRCRFDWGVVLPNVESPPDMGPDLPRDLVLDSRDLADPRRAVDRMFGYWENRGGTSGAGNRALSNEWVDAFVRVLCERHPPASWLARRFDEENRELLRLTEEQKILLDSLAEHPRAAIRGAAGTGKTVLAMEKARRMALAGGKRVSLLCFNTPLAAHLAREAGGEFTVETFHDFCRRLAQRAKLPFKPPKGGDRERRFWTEDAAMLLLEALERLPDERYDAVVVDEGQDFMPDWWPCIDAALKDGGEGTLYAFYDPNQDIYEGGPPKALAILPYQLKYNCRNTKKIAEYAARLVGSEESVRREAPPGERVEEITCQSGAEVVRVVGERIERLVAHERIQPDRIAIISTCTLKHSPFAADHRAGRFGLLNLDDSRSWKGRASSLGGSTRHVVFDTLDRFKGLERDVVILLDLPSESRSITPRHRYAAASRAKNLLVVIRLAAEEARTDRIRGTL